VKFVKEFQEKTKLLLLAPIIIDENRDLKTVLQVLEQQGYARLKWNHKVYRIADFPQKDFKNEALFLVVDRIITKDNEDFYHRLADAIQTTFFEGKEI
jgi:excinuclease ABC subunit A